MLTYNLTNTGSDSLYEYLYKCIRNDILAGNIGAGEKLPSKRAFAKNLGISVITTQSAYEQLVAEGYIYSIPKSGYYVCDIGEGLSVTKGQKTGKSPKSQNDILVEKQEFLADFSSNQTEREMFPFTIWSKTIREVLSDSQMELMMNSPCGGTMELRSAITSYLKEFRNMDVSAHQVIVGAGTEYLYGLLIQLLGNSLCYGVENPGYSKIANICKSHGVSYQYVGIDRQGVLVPELERKNVNVVHTSPAHHFPTGIVMPVSRRYELLSWATKEEKRYIIEDDYDSELRLTGKMIPTLQSIDVSEKVIYMNTFTKTLSSTVRISYMVLPLHLADQFYKKLSFYSCTVSNFEQYTLARFMANGSYEKHLNRLRNYYQKKHDFIVKKFDTSEMKSYFTIHEQDAGVHFLLEVHTKNPEEFQRQCLARRIRLAPLRRYYHGDEIENNIFVMNYTAMRQEQMEQALKIMTDVIKNKIPVF